MRAASGLPSAPTALSRALRTRKIGSLQSVRGVTVETALMAAILGLLLLSSWSLRMVDLVTKDQAKAHLYIDDDSHDAWLDVFIPAMSEAVLIWVKDVTRVYVDPLADPLVVRPVVVAAVLVELASQ